MQDIIKKIYDYSLEEIIGERFGAYSKYIIQDRAIPDVRDGLKPVQRRILYAMLQDHNTFDKAYRKSAKTVGNVMANYHPHGDSSIYDAMIRLSQDFKMREPLIEMHGNNGSIDGDTAAAMRYTEARLSKISNELLKGIERDTVQMAPNFDDTALEPTVLPSKFPNLLVNGGMGISAGYATNIPPHNLEEIIDATIKRIDSPNCHMDSILDIVKGPDFPTGGLVFGQDGIKEAFKTGKGKIIIRSRYEFIKEKAKELIVISEIPYEVNKSILVAKIDEIRIDKKVEGMNEVRDESDRDGLRVVIELKKEADKDLIINYLLKNTPLQITYNYNMVAIEDRRPKLLGLIPILDAYIKHQEEVIRRRSEFDLKHAEKRLHIVIGLVKALSILDAVIKTIRKSSNKQDAKDNLVKEYDFTPEQAEAIVVLQLYKLTNTDVSLLEAEKQNLEAIINQLKEILSDENVLKNVVKKELREIKKEYGTIRRSTIEGEIEEIKIDTTKMIKEEDVVVVATKEGYVKKTSKRSFSSSEGLPEIKAGDIILLMQEASTLDTMLLFTKKGNYLYLPVHEIIETRWKELGKHVSNMITVDPDDEIINAFIIKDFKENKAFTIATKKGMIKKTNLEEFFAQRYKKAITAIKLKKEDEVLYIGLEKKPEIIITTQNGYTLRYNTEEISTVGIKAAGVKAISLKKEDFVASVNLIDENDEYLTIFTRNGTGKRIKLDNISATSRANRGVLLIRNVKTNPYHIVKTFKANTKEEVIITTKSKQEIKKLNTLPINDLSSIGSSISKEEIENVYLSITDIEIPEETQSNEQKDVPKELTEESKGRILTISDFLEDFDGENEQK